jgi:hypothetical protein
MNDKKKRISYNKLTYNNEILLLEDQIKDSFTLYIEIPLYFSQIPGTALPLIAMPHSKIEINFLIKSLENIIIYNPYVSFKYRNSIKMSLIHSIIYLEEFERNLFSTRRHEYLIERKIYNTSIQLDQTKNLQDRKHIAFEHLIKDYYFYVQLQSIVNKKQYYNMTYNYLLPELYMNTRDKLRYLQQVMTNNLYDDNIKQLYNNILVLMINKINILYKRGFTGSILITDLKFLYNNLTEYDISFVESQFDRYYENTLNRVTIDNSQLFLNSVERYYA